MKYIECNHCQKRYPSNRKFEEAARNKKGVRCKECGEPFPIVIHEVKVEKKQPTDEEARREFENSMLSSLIIKNRID
ncbi:MAG: hypothetical protein ABUK11_00970 [Mariprofundaceae bacterium]